MDRFGYAMWKIASKTVNKNYCLTTESAKSQQSGYAELNCHCDSAVTCSQRQDFLSECQLRCGNQDIQPCNFKITLKPINFIDTLPTLFVYEIIETGQVFKSFRSNPRSVVMEFYGLIPVLSQTLKDNALFVDEVTMQEHREHLQTLELLSIFLLVLNKVNEQVFSNLEQTSLWSERVFKYFYEVSNQLSSNEQFIACKEKYTLENIMNSLIEFVNCQI